MSTVYIQLMFAISTFLCKPSWGLGSLVETIPKLCTKNPNLWGGPSCYVPISYTLNPSLFYLVDVTNTCHCRTSCSVAIRRFEQIVKSLSQTPFAGVTQKRLQIGRHRRITYRKHCT